MASSNSDILTNLQYFLSHPSGNVATRDGNFFSIEDILKLPICSHLGVTVTDVIQRVANDPLSRFNTSGGWIRLAPAALTVCKHFINTKSD